MYYLRKDSLPYSRGKKKNKTKTREMRRKTTEISYREPSKSDCEVAFAKKTAMIS